MPQPTPKPRPTATVAYLAAHQQAQRLTERVYDLLVDLPAPEGDIPIDGTHVGTLAEVNRRLAAVVAFRDGTEG